MSVHEVYSLSAESISLFFSSGELKTKEMDSSLGYGVRALDKGRLGFAYCQKSDDLKKSVEESKKMSRFSVQSGFSFPPSSSYPQCDIYDPSLSPEDYQSLRGFVDEARDGAESLGGKARVMLGVSRSHASLENTEGFRGEYDKTDFSLYIECMHDDGFGSGYLGSCKRPSSVHDLGTEAAQMASDMRGAKKPESGTYTLVAEPEALMSLLDTLIPSFSGDWKRRGITKLSSGARLFSEKFSMYEDGLALGTESRPFDDEGTPSKRRPLIENGVVKSFMYDRETSALEARQGGTLGPESGVCSRASYDSAPSIGSSNIVISPGEVTDLGGLDKFIELHYAHGSHTANPTTGDIGLEASAAFLVEKGKRTPLKGFMITGNIFDMFSNIEGIEKKQESYGSLISPRIAFKNVRVVS
jgi:PmbA protein